MQDIGYIKVFRQMQSWEWYKNINVKTVFLHCLIKANFTEGKFEGVKVPVGSFISSYKNMGDELGMPRSTVFNCIKKLEKSGELKRSGNTRYTVFTVVNYDTYQERETPKRHGVDTEETRRRHGVNQYKNTKEIKEEKEVKNSSAPAENDGLEKLRSRTF